MMGHPCKSDHHLPHSPLLFKTHAQHAHSPPSRIYFEIDAYGIHVHAIRRHWISASTWTTMHLPFIMSYILSAATLSQLVLAHDIPDANEHHLGEHYEERSVEEISAAMRWFYCGGLGVALFSMGVISLTHVHKKLTHARLYKRPRLFVRAAVSITIVCLPLAERKLTSLDLIAITTCLTLGVLMLDLYGNSAQGSSFWTGGLCPIERRNTTYTCHKKMSKHKRREIQKALQRGEKVGLAELLKRNGSTSTMSSMDSGTSTPKDEEWTGGHY